MRRTNEPGRDGHRSLRYAELLWFMRLRWLAGAAVAGTGVAWGFWSGWDGIATPLCVLGAMILGYSAVLWMFDRGRAGRHQSRRGLLLFAAFQIYLDLGALATLVTITGGLASPVIGFLVFHMVFAGLLQPRVWAQVSAGVAIAMLAGALAVGGQWPTTELEALTAVGWILTLVITVYLSERIARSMYRRESARLRQNRRLRRMAGKLEAQQAAMIQHEKMAAMGRLASIDGRSRRRPSSAPLFRWRCSTWSSSTRSVAARRAAPRSLLRAAARRTASMKTTNPRAASAAGAVAGAAGAVAATRRAKRAVRSNRSKRVRYLALPKATTASPRKSKPARNPLANPPANPLRNRAGNPPKTLRKSPLSPLPPPMRKPSNCSQKDTLEPPAGA